jgi:RNA polymerase sigma factor (sigma-70 family)
MHTTPKPTDEEQEWLAEQFAWVQKRIERLCMRRPQLAYLADDLLSDAGMALWRALQSAPVDLEHYAKRSVRNAVMKRLKQAGVLRKLPAVLAPKELTNRHDDSDSKVSPDHSGELLSRIEDCCSDPVDLEIIRLRQQGHTGAEVAKALGIDKSTVCRRLKEILKRLENNATSE